MTDIEKAIMAARREQAMTIVDQLPADVKEVVWDYDLPLVQHAYRAGHRTAKAIRTCIETLLTRRTERAA